MMEPLTAASADTRCDVAAKITHRRRGKRLLPASRRPRLSAGAQVANDLMDRCRLDAAQQCDAGRLAALAGAEPVHGEGGVAVPSHVASDPDRTNVNVDRRR